MVIKQPVSAELLNKLQRVWVRFGGRFVAGDLLRDGPDAAVLLLQVHRKLRRWQAVITIAGLQDLEACMHRTEAAGSSRVWCVMGREVVTITVHGAPG